MKISEELFIESIEALKKQWEYDKKCGKAFEVILPNDYVTTYDNHKVTEQLINVLKNLTEDEGEHSWIDYFVFEKDFGADDTLGDVTVCGVDYKLETPEDLWKVINLKYEGDSGNN